MKKLFYIKLLLVSLLVSGLLCLSVVPLFAEEEKPTGDFSVSALSKYVWRGQELSRDSVVIQPSMTVGYKGFAVNVWGNLDTDPYVASYKDDSENWTETDVTLSYSKTLGLFNLGAGYIYYGLAGSSENGTDIHDSQEIYVSLGLNTLLSPTLTVYKEIDYYHQWYFLLGISHTFELSKMVSLKLAATASYLLSEDEETYPEYNDDAEPTKDKFSNFHDGTLTASLPIKASQYVTVTPLISYVFPLSGDAKDEMKGRGLTTEKPSDRDSSFLYGGVTVSFTF
ncbi:protein of unknown function (Gcw_chp) [Syntrophus gentianae]|uniref:Outer membrane scaffolding protein for murein synthesis, MipA/OmpV family n=1 Tax=Syntrophus gentianae TaxID=43775 RepID=A0A1H7YUV2_9BACT|nr:TorF family putative porin [Syntrophus gentianae]SEM49691.1 protein of unknown function (Gcw_chp) [Syntrophus gentianae]